MSKEKAYGPFFFPESTVTGISYLDMMQEWLMPQLDDSDGFIYQQGVSTPQYTSSSAITSISICHKV
jgi:hypothetical protein